MYDGHRYRAIGGTTMTQALRSLEKVRNKVISGDYDLCEKPGNPQIEDFVVTYLGRRQHLKSRKRDALSARILLRYFKGNRLAEITPANIEDYIAKRKSEGVANATVNRELACLKRMFNLAIRWKEAKKNPVNDVDFLRENPGRTRFLSQEEAKRLLDCCSRSLYPIVFTGLNTGMRLSEILGLTWERVHTESVMDPYIEITNTKSGKDRFVPLNNEMIELFQKLKIEKRHKNIVFVGDRGKPLKTVKKPFETALTHAGILNFRFHDLRHTFASYFLMRGGDVLTLKEFLGHSSMKMVERYAHLAPGHKVRQINNLSGVFSGKDCHPNANAHKNEQNLKIVNY